jgi:hypothetical protein
MIGVALDFKSLNHPPNASDRSHNHTAKTLNAKQGFNQRTRLEMIAFSQEKALPTNREIRRVYHSSLECRPLVPTCR